MKIILWTIICCTLLIASSDGTILRLPCKVLADFNVILFGKRLLDHVLMSFNRLNDTQCMVKCVKNVKCRSYNINRKQRRCEISGKALADNGTILKADSDWVYKSTDYSWNLIGPVCTSLNPCGEKKLCKDSCDPPYYKCFYCDADHEGLHCDAAIDRKECSSNPCQNSGKCVGKLSGYRCTCLNGFKGTNCEIDIDECMSLPCFNGGSCINEVGNYTCNCTTAIGYAGKNCEREINECSSNPCKNSGTCVDKFADYHCTCINGFTGKSCENDIDECLNSPCLNGGICNNEYGNYTCNCTNAIGYVGRNCDKDQFVFYQEKLSWENSRQKCVERGGDLASIGTAMEFGIVNKLVPVFSDNRGVWMGLNDKGKEGVFAWSDETTTIFHHWYGSEPNGGGKENCACIGSRTRRYYDIICSRLFNYICDFK